MARRPPELGDHPRRVDVGAGEPARFRAPLLLPKRKQPRDEASTDVPLLVLNGSGPSFAEARERSGELAPRPATVDFRSASGRSCDTGTTQDHW